MLQTNYSYGSQSGVPGGLYDSSPRSVFARANGEGSANAIMYGLGVVQGATPGIDVRLPAAGSTAAQFEGVVIIGVSERGSDGFVRTRPTEVLSVLDWGKVWVRVPTELPVAYGDKAYLIVDGENAGRFTNDDTDTLDINARFISAVDSGDIAVIKLHDAPRA